MAMDLSSYLPFSGISNSISTFITVVLPALIIGGVVAGIIYYFYNYKKYDTKCIILSERAKETNKVLEDLGCYVEKKGSLSFRLRSRKKTIPAPSYKFLLPARDKNYLFLKQTSDNDFIPLEPSFVKDEIDKLKLATVPSDIRLWMNATLEDIRNSYERKSWLQEHALHIAYFGVCALMLVLMIYFINKVSGDIIPAMANVASSCVSGP